MPELIFGQERVSLVHLGDHPISCPTQAPQLPNPLQIRVRYSDHCFTAAYDPAAHRPDQLLSPSVNRGKGRVFDVERYALSRHLPALLAGLPGLRVNFTSVARNYVLVAQVGLPGSEGATVPYGVFFQLRRARAEDAEHLMLDVVSAYRPFHGINIRHDPRHVRFLILASKIFLGERVAPARRCNRCKGRPGRNPERPLVVWTVTRLLFQPRGLSRFTQGSGGEPDEGALLGFPPQTICHSKAEYRCGRGARQGELQPRTVAGDPERRIAAQRGQQGIPVMPNLAAQVKVIAQAAGAGWVLD